MRQPVSRITFDRRRGFLGVHLQEGALFVDAAWNEGADIASSLLRDAIVAGGVAGSAGRELRIEAVEDGGVLRNLRVCGTSPDRTEPPRPFYCDGLPVLWLADRFIDAQPIGDAFRLDATGTSRVPGRGTWIDLLQDDVPYEIFLRAWVDTVDRLDEPFLDDPGLDASRGTFRKRVISEVRIRRADALRRRAGSNLELSVDGSYTSDLNALYRVELDGLTGVPGSPTASVLWDPDAGATVARVVDNALEGAREIMVDSTDGFDNGFVRFEGRDVGPALYRVIKAPGREGAAIQITRHRCDRAELSLAAWQPSGTVQSKPPDRFQATFLVPAPVQAGDLLRGLPAGLDIDAREAKVVAVTDFDPDRNAVTLTLQSPGAGGAGSRALSVADWIADRAAIRNTDGTFTATLVAPPAIVVGDVVTALPPSLGTPTVPWVVLAVEPQAAPPAPPAPPAAPTTAAATPARPLVTVTFGPAGLAQDLAALDLAHRSPLLAAARQFDTTLTVEDHPEWEVGMRISIVAKNDAASAAREDRLIVRIERGVAAPAALRRAPSDAPARVMHVRLDQPLSYDHAAADTDVIPEHPIRVRRFIGHECRLGIDVINPPRDGAASIANFPSGLALPGGLSIHLTTEVAGGEPRIARGDGWHFAARSDGYVDTRLFAPVEDPPASEVALARLTVHAGSHELVDLRPMPAALAVEDELVRIAAAASTIAAQLGDDPGGLLAGHVARLASATRVQPGLLDRLRELAHAYRTKLAATPARRAWLERLARAVSAIAAGSEPTRRELAAIGFAIGGLAYAVSADHGPYQPPATGPSSGTPTSPPGSSPPSPTSPPVTAPPSPPSTTSAPVTAPPVQPARPKPTTLPPPPVIPPAARPAPSSSPPATVPAPSAKRDSKQSLLDRADAMLGKLEDDLKTAASVAVSGVELASKLASLSRSAPGDARPAGEPKPPARPAPKKP